MDALDYARELVSFDSTSRLSNLDVSDAVERFLRRLGFEVERIEYDDPHGVHKANVIARKGRGLGGLAYFGHTDVVPATSWSVQEHGPFEPTVRDGRLYGRGSCDMKGSVACMLAAAARFEPAQLTRPIYITCTADEEVGYGGASEVVARSELYAEMVRGDARGIIGEPTRLEVVYAHKGTYGFRAIARGRAAHSSTEKGVNANLAMIPFLVEMKAIHDELQTDPAWRNAEFDPPVVSWNIGINDHTPAVNITPPQSVCTVYFRPMPGMDADALVERAKSAAERCGIEFHFATRGMPVYTDPKSEFVRETLALAGKTTAHTVPYGTDGAMFSALRQKLVLGPGDIAQAHTDDEWIDLNQLSLGTDLYAQLIRQWCC
ncbi:MAG TPA: M20 family metallopeptidase [Planctomycetaceae bacterium]|nr:M20 family metallopeptidase [Planctomycetaceae bacterium]